MNVLKYVDIIKSVERSYVVLQFLPRQATWCQKCPDWLELKPSSLIQWQITISKFPLLNGSPNSIEIYHRHFKKIITNSQTGVLKDMVRFQIFLIELFVKKKNPKKQKMYLKYLLCWNRDNYMKKKLNYFKWNFWKEALSTLGQKKI